MRHWRLTHSFALLLTLLLSIKLMAAELEMVVTEHFPPYQVKAGDKLEGVAVEVVNALLEHEKINTQHIILPWSRAYHIATQQKNVMIYNLPNIFKTFVGRLDLPDQLILLTRFLL